MWSIKNGRFRYNSVTIQEESEKRIKCRRDKIQEESEKCIKFIRDKYLNSSVNQKIHIDIIIPFYNYNNTENTKYKVTEKIFKHYSNIKGELSELCDITFTMIGSEKDSSMKLVEQTLGIENYYEFEQDRNKEFLVMLAEKHQFGLGISINKNPDILLLCGSNDYIPIIFFRKLLEQYNPYTPQMYGISNKETSNSVVLFGLWDDQESQLKDQFYWDGKYKYDDIGTTFCGGCIGVNKSCYSMYNLEEIWTFDEKFNEIVCMKEEIIHKVIVCDCYFLNIKTTTDITPFSLLNSDYLDKIDITKISSEIVSNINKDLQNFIHL